MNNEDNGSNIKDYLRPRVGDEEVLLPITFDYKGGRSESVKARRILAIVLGVSTFALDLFILFLGKSSFLYKVFIITVISIIISFVIRYLVLREYKYRNLYYEQMDSDYKLDTKDIWGIYDITDEDSGIRIAHFRSGMIGAFIALEKYVVVGMTNEDEFQHFEAISDAFKSAAQNKAIPIHIDYMSHDGKDSRIQKMYEDLAECKNPELKHLMNRVCANLEELVSYETTTFDVYVLLMNSYNPNYRGAILEFTDLLRQANYTGFNYLSDKEMRDITKDLFNLKDFSVVEAEKEALSYSIKSMLSPISLTNSSGTVILGKTIAQKRAERQEKARQEQLIRQEKTRRKEKDKRKKAKKRGKQVPTVTEEIEEFVEF